MGGGGGVWTCVFVRSSLFSGDECSRQNLEHIIEHIEHCYACPIVILRLGGYMYVRGFFIQCIGWNLEVLSIRGEGFLGQMFDANSLFSGTNVHDSHWKASLDTLSLIT